MKTSYRCSDCGTSYEIDPKLMVCPSCSATRQDDEPLRGVLEVEYEGALSADYDIFELLPVEKEHFAPMPVGNTPLWEPRNLREETGFANLYIKDDGANPTASFKDRASFLVSAFAKKHGINEIVLASTGNAGSSMAGIGAAAGQQITLFLPKTAPAAKMIQAQQYGANLILADGNYDFACALALDYTERFGGMNRNTAYNPMTLEGKKTVSLEIAKQLGNKAPDYVFVSVGDGCIIGGVYKGFKDLLKFGLIDKMPVIYCVQSTGSDAITRAFNSEDGKFENKGSSTIADSISVDVPANGYYVLNHLKQYNGRCITVSDEFIVESQKKLSETTGLFSEPAGATAFAGFMAARDQMEKDATVVVLTTGNGLKDPATAAKGNPALPAPISSIDELA